MQPAPTEPAPDAPTPPVSAEPALRDTAPEVLDASGTAAAPDAPCAPDEVVIPAPIVIEPYPYPGIPAAWEAPAQAYRDAVDAWLRADLEHHARAAHADELARIRREAVHTSVDAGEVPTTIPWARVVEALYAMERAYEAVRVARGKVREAHAEYEAATRTRYG